MTMKLETKTIESCIMLLQFLDFNNIYTLFITYIFFVSFQKRVMNSKMGEDKWNILEKGKILEVVGVSLNNQI